ncbi:hypothetical protein ACWOC1_04050 [Enterococcus quebecensis]|uniref:DUF2680 domain-containing protein n=1 Tax=Enterococcus quebecensis TaxID=903983 RepID=A0A1E5GWY9_9ENTE|nr:hypothetical protein [Enterococcus quebecensis]OEG17192.1 hypothetical protein BCR23_04090 [Enterococcus quebecensis]OJG75583.1 hypothetical protein RV12_GL001386 [Enterococcus quebecensis]
MKKKIISSLILAVFLGAFGIFTVAEAVGNSEDNRMNTFEMEGRGGRHWKNKQEDITNELEKRVNAGELTKKEASDIQKEWKETTDYSFHRRGRREHSQMDRDNRRNYGRMNNSCW